MSGEHLSLNDLLLSKLAQWATGWHSSLSFTTRQLDALARRLHRIAVVVGGEPVPEDPLDDIDGVVEYTVAAADEGLRYHLRRAAGGLGDLPEPPVHWVEDRPDPPVTLGHAQSRLNLSDATEGELAVLPGISPALAKRIRELREAGGLTRFEDLLNVAGLGPAKTEALRHLVYVDERAAGRVLSTPELDAFRRRPCTASLVDLLRATGGVFTTAAGRVSAGKAASLEEAVLAEVGRAAEAVAANPPPGGGPRPVSTGRASRVGRLLARGRALENSQVTQGEAAWAGIVSGSAYLDLALRLLRGARREITVTMFFMTYAPGQTHPSNALVEELVAARRRGVRVSVTLDLDRPGDVFGSRLVNRAAFDCLKSGGVDVAWDRPERLTHTKLLIVDGRDVLAGSHNWTAGSLYAYDDKSLVVRSEALAEVLGHLAAGIHEGG